MVLVVLAVETCDRPRTFPMNTVLFCLVDRIVRETLARITLCFDRFLRPWHPWHPHCLDQISRSDYFFERVVVFICDFSFYAYDCLDSFLNLLRMPYCFTLQKLFIPKIIVASWAIDFAVVIKTFSWIEFPLSISDK